MIATLKEKSDFNAQKHFDLKKVTIQQLRELIERQNKLLKNSSFLEKLPDKGVKIILFYNKLLNEQKSRDVQINVTCQIFSNLKLSESAPDELEWNEENTKNLIDSDENFCSDNEKLCFKLISNHSGTALGLKAKCDTKEKNYITSFCKKYDLINKSNDRFKLNQLQDCSQDFFLASAKKVKEKLGDKWEITEATPPIFAFSNTKSLSLYESLKLQKKHFSKIKNLKNSIISERKNTIINVASSLSLYNVESHNTFQNISDECSEDLNLSNFDEEENK